MRRFLSALLSAVALAMSGMAFDWPVGESDWSGYDRIEIAAENPHDYDMVWTVRIADTNTTLKSWQYPQFPLRLGAGRKRLLTVPLCLPERIDATQITNISFSAAVKPWSAQPKVVSVRLLRPDDAAREDPYYAEDWRSSQKAFAVACGADSSVSNLVGWAYSTERVFPKGRFALRPIRDVVRVSLGRNEREAVQIAVVTKNRLRNVRIEVKGVPGVTVAPVAYTRKSVRAHYPTRDEAPWWPDMILEHVKSVDIPPETTQSFWVRVATTETSRTGIHRGQLVVWADGRVLRRMPFEINIWNFMLSGGSPLPTLVSYFPEMQVIPPTREKQEKWLREQTCPVNIVKGREGEWADFLADYYITCQDLYSRQPLDWNSFVRLKRRGRLGLFNYHYWTPYIEGDVKNNREFDRRIEEIMKRYQKAKELGLAEHGVLYGADEAPAKLFPAVAEAVRRLKAAFPEIPVLTTTMDDSFGVTGVLRHVEWFCPLTEKYDLGRVDRARAEGHRIWWYVCCGPGTPYANFLLEYEPIEPRLLMGAMAVKFKPDGFLYYAISIWNSRRVIEGRNTFTDWEPRTFGYYHGDGCWTAVGPSGRPLPTIRLENFRDGLEDYAYAKLLERRLAAHPDRTDRWSKLAEEALRVPKSLVESLRKFSIDPAELYAWRAKMADLLESD